MQLDAYIIIHIHTTAMTQIDVLDAIYYGM